MTFKELQENVAKYEAIWLHNKKTNKFARNVAALIPIVGTWFVVGGLLFIFSDFENLSPILTGVWSFILSVFEKLGITTHVAIYVSIPVIGLLSSLLAFICVLVYSKKKLEYEVQYNKKVYTMLTSCKNNLNS